MTYNVGDPYKLQNLFWKINQNLILLHDALDTPNDKIQILHIKGFVGQIVNRLKTFKHKNFSNLFFIVIEFSKPAKNSILPSLEKKFRFDETIFVQILCEKASEFYKKNKNETKFYKINFGDKKLGVNIENYDDLLRAIKNSGLPFVDINLGDLITLNPDQALKLAIECKDEILFKIFLLFSEQIDRDVLQNIFISNNLNFLSICCMRFELSEVVLKRPNIIEIFKKFVKSNDERVIKALTTNPEKFKEVVDFKSWNNLKEIAHDKNFKGCFYELQKIEEIYLNDFVKERIDKNFKNLDRKLEDVENNFQDPENYLESKKVIKVFHNAIGQGNLSKVQDIAKNFQDFKIFIDENGTSALEKSIDFKQFKIYTFLLSESFITLNQAGLDKKIQSLDENEKSEIKKLNLKYSKSNPENFINILCTKCNLFALSGKISYREIREMIRKLSNDENLKELLMKTSELDLKIVFDFHSETIDKMCPCSGSKVMGINFYEDFQILIGKDEGKFERFGTFVHELSHQILYLLYENECLPYCKGDKKRKKLFDEVFEATSQKYRKDELKTDKIIRMVFQNSPNVRKVEMAVRANHLLARYIEDKEKLENHREIFKELFDFNEQFINDLKIPNVIKLIKLNNDFGIFKMVQESKIKLIEYERVFEESNEGIKTAMDSDDGFMENKVDVESSEVLAVSHDEIKSNIKDSTTQIYFKNAQKTTSNPLIIQTPGKRIILSSNLTLLTILKLMCEVFVTSSPKVKFKAENIFINFDILYQNNLKHKLLKLVKTSNIQRIFVLIFENFDENILKFILSLGEDLKVFLICCEKNLNALKDKLKINHESITHDWMELSEKSKNFLYEKDLKFQTNVFKLKELLPVGLINSKILPIIASNYNEVNTRKETLKLEYFIKRLIIKREKSKNISNANQEFFLFPNENIETFKKPVTKEFKLEDFVNDVKNDNVVLVSDQAGSGKTVFLHKILQIYQETFPTIWISFVGLKDHVDELSKCVEGNFEDFIIKILNFDALEAQIFKEKFSKGEVRILFDAFDEISPKCKEETLKLFKKFLEACKNIKNGLRNQIWITTRTHLEHDLESELNVLAHKLKSLKQNEQIEFLRNIWKISNINENLIQLCAEKLVQRINEMISKTLSVIGLPLIVEGLGKYFSDKIDENFIGEIQSLKISVVYEKIIIKGNLKILHSKFPQIVEDNLEKSESIFKVYFFYAILYLFNEELAENVGLIYDPDEWSPEEISRGGITNYDKNGNLKFNHETYAEFLVALFLFGILKNVKFPTIFQIDLLNKILKSEKLQICRMFLNDMIENVERKKLKFFHSKNKNIENFLNEIQTSTLRFVAKEGFVNIFQIIIELTKEHNLRIYKSIMETQDEKLKKTILMEILPKIKNIERFSQLLNDILEVYDQEIFPQILNQLDSNGNSILHHMTVEEVDAKIFELFSEMLFKNTEEVNLRKLFLIKNKKEENFLHFCLKNYDKNFEKLEIIIEMVSKVLSIEEQKEIISTKSSTQRNILHSIAFEDENVVNLLFSFIENIFDVNELQSLIAEKDDNFDNVLHLAAHYCKSKEVFVYFWVKISKIVECQKSFLNVRGKFDRTVLQRSLLNTNCPEIFIYNFEIVESLCGENLQNIILENNSENVNLFSLAITFACEENLKYFLKRIGEILSEIEIKKLLKSKGFRNRNLLALSLQNHNLNSTQLFWKLFEENLSREELVELLNEKDDDNDGFLQLAAQFTKSVEIFGFLWLKISQTVQSPKEYFYGKGIYDRNALLRASTNNNDPKIFQLIFDLAKTFCNNEEEIKNLFLEVNSENKNLLTIAINFAPKFNVEYLFRKTLEIFGAKGTKNLLKTVKGFKRRNLLIESVGTSYKTSLDLTWKLMTKNLSQEDFLEILHEKDANGDNVLHIAAVGAKSIEIFKFLWLKISETVESPKDFFMTKGLKNRNILQCSSINFNTAEIFPYTFEIAKSFLDVEELKKLFLYKNAEGENLLVYSCFITKSNLQNLLSIALEFFGENEMKQLLNISKDSKERNLLSLAAIHNKNLDSIELLFNFYEKHFTKCNLVEILSEKDTDGNTILHLAANFAKSKEIFEFLCFKVFEFIENPKEFTLQKGSLNQNILQKSVKNECINIFSYTFELIENYSSSKNEIKNFILDNDSKLINLIATYSKKVHLEYLLVKMREYFNENEIRDILVSTKCHQSRSLLSEAVLCKSFEFFKLLWEIYETILKEEELKAFLLSKDATNDDFLHFAAQFVKTCEIFNFILEKFCKKFDEKTLSFYLRLKGFRGRNILMASISTQNVNSFYKIFETALKSKDFIYELEDLGQTFLHYLARFGSVSMLEFSFEKLQQLLEKEELESFMRMQTENGNNLIHCAALQNNKSEAVKFLLDKIIEILGWQSLKNFLTTANEDKLYPFEYVVRYNTIEVFNTFVDVFEHNITKDEIDDCLDAKYLIKFAAKNEKFNDTKNELKLFLDKFEINE